MKGKQIVYGVLLVVWTLVVAWQAVDHSRVRQAARAAIINHVKDISTTLGLVLRSQRRFGGVISKERIESALNSLVNPEDIIAIALLNDAAEVVASAGETGDFPPENELPSQGRWTDRSVTLMNLVDLGTNVTQEGESLNPTIVIPRTNFFGTLSTNRQNLAPSNAPAFDRPRPPPPPPDEPPPEFGARTESRSNAQERASAPDSRRGRFRSREGEGWRPPFGRPPWMGEAEYKSLIQKRGVHSFVVILSTQAMQEAIRHDFWQRLVISILAAVSVVGLGLAWRNLVISSELEVRLVRAAELNTRLKEMNFAAAGLAHETRNPLNIIRGLAQIISRHEDGSDEIRRKSRDIVAETDRVTAQLNEFINYSRPREVRRATVPLNNVVGEVLRALGNDLEEKSIQLRVQENLPAIEADEQLLRQALFNLVLNAIQAVSPGGEIQIRAVRSENGSTCLEIRDNGPGVPPEQRLEIFKPYFTTHQKGTGLGLAIVQQIVLAHGWEIECRSNEPKGALFSLSHLKLAAAS
jgi:signal transduction histidine kinase